MAALGAIGTLVGALSYRKQGRAWTPGTSGIRACGASLLAPTLRYNPSTNKASVSGAVRSDGVFASRLVRAYRRDNGELLGSTTSSPADGSYTIALGYTGEVYVIAFDAAGAPVLNASILDYVVPV